jgi:hypothetical protein
VAPAELDQPPMPPSDGIAPIAPHGMLKAVPDKLRPPPPNKPRWPRPVRYRLMQLSAVIDFAIEVRNGAPPPPHTHTHTYTHTPPRLSLAVGGCCRGRPCVTGMSWARAWRGWCQSVEPRCVACGVCACVCLCVGACVLRQSEPPPIAEKGVEGPKKSVGEKFKGALSGLFKLIAGDPAKKAIAEKERRRREAAKKRERAAKAKAKADAKAGGGKGKCGQAWGGAGRGRGQLVIWCPIRVGNGGGGGGGDCFTPGPPVRSCTPCVHRKDCL